VTEAAKDTLNTVTESAGAVAGTGQAKESRFQYWAIKANQARASPAASVKSARTRAGLTGEPHQVAALAGKYGETFLAGQIEKFRLVLTRKIRIDARR